MSETAVQPHMRAEDILAEIRANLLECKVCFEKFSIQKRDHTPRNLPCGHVLCLKCICALSNPENQKLECPFCRKQWDMGSTSECYALTDLQELLLSEARPRLYDRVIGWTESLGSGTLHLRSAFGGWGTIVNPSGIVVSETSGQIVLVHDDAGDQSVKVFTSKGRPVAAIRDSFRLPWGVDVDARGRVFVTDAEMGTLSQIVLDLSRGVVLVVFKELRLVFDINGDVIVGDSQNGMVWSLGKPQKTPALTPLVSGLLRPVGLATTTMNVLVVLDAGDHAVKFYAADKDDLYLQCRK
ncbi:RING-type domain-containing protein [Pimephales promelas]|nr:RING-type domain-containing protein [Pimephales promelas]